MTEKQQQSPVLRGPLLLGARAAWVALVVLSVALVALGFRPAVDEISTICHVPAECSLFQITSEGLEALEGIGLSVHDYAVLNVVGGFVLVEIGFIAIGLFMFWRRSDEWVALLVSITLVGIVVFGFDSPADSLGKQNLAWEVTDDTLGGLSFVSFLLLFFLFPNGRFVPRWMWPLVLAGGTLLLVLSLLTSLTRAPVPTDAPLIVALIMVLLAAGLYAQVHRYVRVSSQTQRQQTKWVVAGFASMVFSFFVYMIAYTFLFPVDNPDPGRAYFNLYSIPPAVFLTLLFPLSIVFAILRYRLWDIDIIVNRALVYGLLTVTLGSGYFVSVVLLQAAFRTVTGQESTLALIASTLTIAALFQPVRRAIQRIIDRRFYRSRHDAARTLARFGATVRDEVDLSRLSDALVGVVDETFRPAHVSLWLRRPEHRGYAPRRSASR